MMSKYALSGILALLAVYTGSVFAGSCNLSTLSIANRTKSSLTWSAGIDKGAMAAINSTMTANVAQPILPGHQVNISLNDDESGVRGYVNVYNGDDQLIATLMINYSNESKGCKLVEGYKNIADGYKITYEPPDKSSSINPSKSTANLTYCIEQH